MNGFEIQCQPGYAEPREFQLATSGTAHPEDWLFEALGGGKTDSGILVNEQTAMSHGPVWGAVNLLASDVGQLPLHVMRKRGKKREKFEEHPVEWLLNSEPNEMQTPAIWKETMMSWALLWGNACCYIERDGRGSPIELIPLLPDRTYPRLVKLQMADELTFDFWVIVTDVGGKQVPLLYQDVFHLRGLATDGFWGLSAVQVVKNVVGHGLALEKHGNRLFSNGAMPAGVLEHPGTLSKEARANLREEWYAVHGGLDNRGKMAILMEGMKFDPMSMSNKDAEYLDDRKFNVKEVARMFNVPPFKLGDMEESSVRANLEEQNRDYFTTSLSRHLNKFKEEGERKLFSAGERRLKRVFLRWFPEAFLRGDTKSRFEAYSLAITSRILSPNEVREKEDMNPYDGGDEFLNPAIEQTKKSEDEPSKPKPKDPEQRIARQLVENQVKALLDTEANALVKSVGADGPKNFCRWAANYYENYTKMAGNFVELPAKIAGESGFLRSNWKKSIELHAQDGLQSLLLIAESVTKSGLASSVKDRAEFVRGMVDGLTDSILGVGKNA